MSLNYKPNGWELDCQQAIKERSFFEIEFFPSEFKNLLPHKIKSPELQLASLKLLFPNLKSGLPKISKLPRSADGWLVMPKIDKIAKDYNNALVKVLKLLEASRPYFANYREGELDRNYLRLTSRTKKALGVLNDQYKGDFLIIPIQMGLKHMGRSARRDYVLMKDNEFGLGPLEIAVFLLSHTDWLSTNKDFGIDATGCEYGPYNHKVYKYFLFFYFFCGKLRFDTRWSGCPDRRFGPASGFL